MIRKTAVAFLLVFLAAPPTVRAQQAAEKIANASSAAPASIADAATIMDWDETMLREGTNGWVCLPDPPNSPGNDPMCLDGPWQNWAKAWMGKTEPDVDRMGFGYMITSDGPGSNVDPYAEGPTDDNEWLEGGPHIMIIVPDEAWLEGLPTDTGQGGPWVMWSGTPYVHVMIPLPKP